jgi:hypothetical protein
MTYSILNTYTPELLVIASFAILYGTMKDRRSCAGVFRFLLLLVKPNGVGISAKTQILYVYLLLLRIVSTRWSELEATLFSVYRVLLSKVAALALAVMVVEKMTDKYKSTSFFFLFSFLFNISFA